MPGRAVAVVVGGLDVQQLQEFRRAAADRARPARRRTAAPRLARLALGDPPEDARRVIDEAHREAKVAITELNTLVRGLHPAVLEDRGLGTASSGAAARLPDPGARDGGPSPTPRTRG